MNRILYLKYITYDTLLDEIIFSIVIFVFGSYNYDVHFYIIQYIEIYKYKDKC